MKCRLEFLEALKVFDKKLYKKYEGDRVVDMLSFKDLTDSALTKDHEDYVMNEENHLPTSFVPGRNLIFMCYASSYAYTIKADTVIPGVGQSDYSGSPNCRDNTMKALERAVNLGMESNLKFETPLMFKSKAQTFYLGYELGGMDFVKLIVEKTHTCYEGQHDKLHAWGYGCGECPSCKLRKKGYEEFLDSLKK